MRGDGRGSQLWWADLVRAWEVLDAEARLALVREFQPETNTNQPDESDEARAAAAAETRRPGLELVREHTTPEAPTAEPVPPTHGVATVAPAMLWAVCSMEDIPRPASGDRLPSMHMRDRQTLPDRTMDPLVRWSELERRLLPSLYERGLTRALELRQAVRVWSRGETLRRLPCVARPRRPRRVWLWIDQSRGLRAFDADQRMVWAQLMRWPESERACRVLRAGPWGSQLDTRNEPVGSDRFAPGDVVLAHSFLGTEPGQSDGSVAMAWRQRGRWLRREGVRPIALAPLWTPGLAAQQREWAVVVASGRHGSSQTPQQRRQAAECLVDLLHHAYWIERALLRDVRLSCLPETDALVEVEVYAHPHVDASHPDYAVVKSEHCIEHSLAAARLEPRLRWAADAELRRHHEASAPRYARAEEIALTPALASDEDLAWSEAVIRAEADRIANAKPHDRAAAIARGLEGLARLRAASPKLAGVMLRAIRHGERSIETSGYELGELIGPPPPGAPDESFDLWQRGDELRLERVGADEHGSWVGRIVAAQPLIAVDGLKPAVQSRRRLEPGLAIELPAADVVERPAWADDAGRDEFGLWASVKVGPVRFRMRWIEPGRATIGSPVFQPGRSDNEVQRDVEFEEGFWLAETPTTQALWREVMGDEPSKFRGSGRPVENVSWDDAQRFVEGLQARAPGLEARLPTEEAWEYACRAGTTAETYAGDMGYGEEVTARALDAIAWYRANSRNETHPVGTKAPNAWGLYDTLGNVWEWTSSEMGSGRVLRGGSWSNDARAVRAACRVADMPADRGSLVGFRLSRGQVDPVQADQKGRLGSRARPDVCARRARVSLRTDRTLLSLEAFPRPAWAHAFGRDRFGLWADDVIVGVRLRLRWIPPGRFWMGSPKDEPGRLDNEGPRHAVLLSGGYWLAEVPCTQDLWTAVSMAIEEEQEHNPSQFRSPHRPVDGVNWARAHYFTKSLSGLGHPGYRLPTEAQWEYACRAGSSVATYGRTIDVVVANTAPALDGIAWYRGNSGVGWDLPVDVGEDSSGWREKQSDQTPAGTREVGKKLPNAWGLYDMLGNVWEWCSDGQREYQEDPVVDPFADGEVLRNRVLRGGSWCSDARDVRAARRDARFVRAAYQSQPQDYVEEPLSDVGFRLSRGQLGPEEEQALGISRSKRGRSPRSKRGR